MQSVLIVIHLIVVTALVVVVLLQRSEGGAIGIGGGGGFMTGRGQANVLTRATSILAGLFFATSLGLTILAGLNREPEVIFESIKEVAPAGSGLAEPETSSGNLLDQLKRMEQERPPVPEAPPVKPEASPVKPEALSVKPEVPAAGPAPAESKPK